MPPVTEKIKVLYILGTGRCGSTLLEGILSRAPEFFACGELMFLWDGRLRANDLCGCGVGLRDCSFWSKVVGPSPDDAGMLDFHSMRRTIYRNWPNLFFGRQRALSEGETLLAKHARRVARLYERIQAVSGASIIIDSSKASFYGCFLASIPSLDVRFVHLVRDPRGVAHSWTRKRLRPEVASGDAYSRQWPYFHSAFRWLTHNLCAEGFGIWTREYLRVRYEDMVRSPQRTLEGILAHVDAAGRELVDPGFTVTMPVNHTVAGNPVRFRTGTMTLRIDDEWKKCVGLGHQIGIAAITLPLLLPYGYGLLDGQR